MGRPCGGTRLGHPCHWRTACTPCTKRGLIRIKRCRVVVNCGHFQFICDCVEGKAEPAAGMSSAANLKALGEALARLTSNVPAHTTEQFKSSHWLCMLQWSVYSRTPSGSSSLSIVEVLSPSLCRSLSCWIGRTHEGMLKVEASYLRIGTGRNGPHECSNPPVGMERISTPDSSGHTCIHLDPEDLGWLLPSMYDPHTTLKTSYWTTA